MPTFSVVLSVSDCSMGFTVFSQDNVGLSESGSKGDVCANNLPSHLSQFIRFYDQQFCIDKDSQWENSYNQKVCLLMASTVHILLEAVQLCVAMCGSAST